ncbi:MAG: hypothetical protein ABI165_16545, partial [Bryobacteraceae bacterium]
MRKIGFALLFLPLAMSLAQTTPKQRDLKYEEESAPNTAKAPAVTIPRSFALIVGIAKYPKLPAQGQLDFSERDAQAMYSILISPEGGNFHAEDVHRLIGAQATLAGVRHELEDWLPSV